MPHGAVQRDAMHCDAMQSTARRARRAPAPAPARAAAGAAAAAFLTLSTEEICEPRFGFGLCWVCVWMGSAFCFYYYLCSADPAVIIIIFKASLFPLSPFLLLLLLFILCVCGCVCVRGGEAFK